jgi:hypothetical protein
MKRNLIKVMYMYYLLGYRILGQCEQRMKSLMKLIEESPDKRNYRRHFDQNEDLHVYYKDILGPRLLLEVIFQTYSKFYFCFVFIGRKYFHSIR